MSQLTLIVATWWQPAALECVQTWNEPAIVIPKMGILDAYQQGYERCHSDILGFVHDDLRVIDQDWKVRVLAEFDDPAVAIVGFAGAPGYGHPLMYQKPYHFSCLGRVGFASNMVNAEQHGARFTGSRSVSVLDGMALFIRRTFLDAVGGWKWRMDTPCSYYLYAEATCFVALRKGYKIRQVGVACDHLNGRSTGLNPNLNPDFEAEHRWLYESFRDVMPVMVTE